jgi:hypothetical protein
MGYKQGELAYHLQRVLANFPSPDFLFSTSLEEKMGPKSARLLL